MIYLTSDLHGYHSNICYGTSVWPDKERDCRKYDTVEEMNNAIVNSINGRVGIYDTLIHCGDFAFGNPFNVYKFRRQINCANIIQINGNHDNSIRKTSLLKNGINLQSLFIKTTETEFIFEYHGYKFICSHYPPQSSTNFNIPNTIWCHGHQHHKCDNDEMHTKYNVIDVGWNGMVYSIDEIINIIKNR